MKTRLIPLALASVGVFLVADCYLASDRCKNLSKDEAIRIALRAMPEKSHVRADEWAVWGNRRITKVELRKGVDWPAEVYFAGDEHTVKSVTIYDDCGIDWHPIPQSQP